MAAEETGAEGEEREGIFANGMRNARKLHGRDGRELSVSFLIMSMKM
jgi:hypothetical protein